MEKENFYLLAIIGMVFIVGAVSVSMTLNRGLNPSEKIGQVINADSLKCYEDANTGQLICSGVGTSSSKTTTTTCDDSDGGQNILLKGSVMTKSGTISTGPFADTCISKTSILEHYCENGLRKNVTKLCDSGNECYLGECSIPSIAITKIRITSDAPQQVDYIVGQVEGSNMNTPIYLRANIANTADWQGLGRIILTPQLTNIGKVPIKINSVSLSNKQYTIVTDGGTSYGYGIQTAPCYISDTINPGMTLSCQTFTQVPLLRSSNAVESFNITAKLGSVEKNYMLYIKWIQ